MLGRGFKPVIKTDTSLVIQVRICNIRRDELRTKEANAKGKYQHFVLVVKG